MSGVRITAIAFVLILWGAATSLQGGVDLPGWVRVGAGLLVLQILPGWWLAGKANLSRSLRWQIPLSFGVSSGLLALLAYFFHMVNLPLNGLLVPLFLFSLLAAFTPLPRQREGERRRDTLLILALFLLLFFLTGPRTGCRTDAYDHLGTVRQMIDHDDVLPGEYFHAGREGNLDPRKGSNHTAFALLTSLVGVDPVDAYGPFWASQVFILLFAIHSLGWAVLRSRGGAWIGTVLFLLLFRGGPGEAWFFTAGYPGRAGILLYFLIAAVTLSAVREGPNRWVLLLLAVLGAGASGVHAFSVFLSGAGLAALVAGILIYRPLRSFLRPTLLCLAAFAAGAAPLLLLRLAWTFASSNALHIHRQAVLILPGELAVMDPVTFLEVVSIGGVISFFLIPFVRGDGGKIFIGELFLIASSILVLLLVWNPLFLGLLEERGSYMIRRVPALAPLPLLLAAVIRRGWKGRLRPGTAIPAVIAVLAAIAPLSAAGDADFHLRTPFRSVEGEPPWLPTLAEVAASIPEGSTVLTDPVTGYVLFGYWRIHPVAVIDQHSSPNDEQAPRRLAESQRFMRGRIEDGEADGILRRYQVDYVLVNELFPQSFRTYNAFVHLESFRNAVRWMQERPLRYAEIETPPGISLFRVVGEGREEERAAPREDLAVGGPALAVPQEGNLILLGGRLGKKHAAPGEGIPMTTLWSLQGSDAGPLPMSLYARAYRPGEPRAERFSLVRSREKAPWRIFTLGGLAYPYILWKEGDRVLDEQLLRVPKETPDGTYIIEVTAHASPFRPVRRLSGMERGAIRTGWTVIDTVEVRS